MIGRRDTPAGRRPSRTVSQRRAFILRWLGSQRRTTHVAYSGGSVAWRRRIVI